jgi:hypothetical protein
VRDEAGTQAPAQSQPHTPGKALQEVQVVNKSHRVSEQL